MDKNASDSPAITDRHAQSVRRITEAAARAAAPWVGQRDKEAADRAAVDAMASAFDEERLRGRVIVGEGEKDGAPRFGVGQMVGAAPNPVLDIAVDPVEGTRLVAEGRNGGMAALALAPSGTLLNLGMAFYMRKLIVGGIEADDFPPDALDQPPKEVVPLLAESLEKPVAEITVAVQERPRNAPLIRAIRATGAEVHCFADGDLSYAVLAALPESAVDALWSIGGAPETVLAACALKGLRAAVWGRLQPQQTDEAERIHTAGFDEDTVFSGADLVATDDVVFAATGITPGPLFDGVQSDSRSIQTHSLVALSRAGALRRTTTRSPRPNASPGGVS